MGVKRGWEPASVYLEEEVSECSRPRRSRPLCKSPCKLQI